MLSLVAVIGLKKHVKAHKSEVSGEIISPWHGRTVQDLHHEYSNIFKVGNRNAASHLWVTFLLDRAPFMTSKTLLLLAGGFCAISGSSVHPSAATRYRMNLERVDGSGKVAGSMFYCCWPCVCDTNDFIRVDTKTVVTADGGARTFNVTVIGDPCLAPGMLHAPFLQPFDKRTTTIATEAREVRCSKQGLEGATYSDHGFVIIGLYFAPGKHAQDGSTFDSMCEDRANAGYNSGMGEIFRQVAAISPVEVGGALVAPSALPPRQLVSAARRQGLDARGQERGEVVARLEHALPERLRRLKPRALRAAAARLRVDAPPISTKSQKEALVQRLAAALSTPAPSPPPASSAELAAMNVRELQAEADRRGRDRRHCIERKDLLRLLTDETMPAHDENEGADGEVDEEQCDVVNSTTLEDGSVPVI
jgi:hypothetical protein